MHRAITIAEGAFDPWRCNMQDACVQCGLLEKAGLSVGRVGGECDQCAVICTGHGGVQMLRLSIRLKGAAPLSPPLQGRMLNAVRRRAQRLKGGRFSCCTRFSALRCDRRDFAEFP